MSLLRRRRLESERLESRQLLAVLLSENFDPIDNANFSSIVGGTVLGASQPTQFHDGNGLYFNGSSGREARLQPLSISAASISFRLRIGGVPEGFFEDADSGEDIVLEASTNGGTNWQLLKTFDTEDPAFNSRDTWGLAQADVPGTVWSVGTLFRWRQLDHSGSNFDHWAIDDIVIDGSPFAIAVLPVSPDPRATSVDVVDLLFGEPVDEATLGTDDVTLTRDGGANILPAGATITKIDDTHFQITGLAGATDDLGSYTITVDGNAIDKADGTPIGQIAQESWLRKALPQVADIIDVSPDPRDTGVTSIDVTFSEPIQLASFNRFDLRLTLDGGDNLITSAVTTSFVSGTTYRINGLFSLTEARGTYRLVVSGDFTDNFNITGSSSATETWINNLPPQLSLGGSTTFVENGPARLLARGALASDPDDTVLAGGSLNVAITANAASGDRLRVKNAGSGAGQIGVTPDRIVRYEGVVIGRFSGGDAADPLIVTLNSSATLPAVQALVRSITFKNLDSNPPAELRTVQFVLDDGDGGISLPQFKYVNIQRNSGLPQISMGGEPSYTENAAPLVVSPFARLEDPDSPNFDGGKLTVAIAQNADADDRLSVRNQGSAAGEIGVSGSDVTFGGVTIGTLSGGVGTTPLEVALNVNATESAVRALIRNIQFTALGNNPSTALRTLSWVLDDGDGGVNSPVLKQVRVLAVNDAAVLTADPGPVGYVNNDAAGVLFASTATVADPDSPNFNYGQLTVAVVRGAVAANRLEIGGAFTRSGNNVLLGGVVIGKVTGNGVGFDSLVINFTGQATRSIVEQLVRSLRFRSVNAVSAFERTIAITVLDTPDGFGSTALVKVAVQSS